MKTYRQKIEELRLKALREIEAGLNAPEQVTRFVNAVMFFNFTSPDLLDHAVPIESGQADDNERGAEVLTEEKEQ